MNLKGLPNDASSAVARVFRRAEEIARERGSKMIWFEDVLDAAAEIGGDDPDIVAIRQAENTFSRRSTRAA